VVSCDKSGDDRPLVREICSCKIQQREPIKTDKESKAGKESKPSKESMGKRMNDQEKEKILNRLAQQFMFESASPNAFKFKGIVDARCKDEDFIE